MERKTQQEIKVDNLKELERSLRSNCRSLAEEIGVLDERKKSVNSEVEEEIKFLNRLKAENRVLLEERPQFEAYKDEELRKIEDARKELSLNREAVLAEREAFKNEESSRKDIISGLEGKIIELSTKVKSLEEIKSDLDVKAKLLIEVSTKVVEFNNLIEEEKRVIARQHKFQEETIALFKKEFDEITKAIEEARQDLSDIQKQKEGVAALERARQEELDKKEKDYLIRAERLKRVYKEKLGIDIKV